MSNFIDAQAVTVKRGSTFSYLLQLPSTLVAEDQFSGWTLKSQIRGAGIKDAEGFVAELTTTWVEDSKYMTVRVFFQDTSAWPIGFAELDVVFTAPVTEESPVPEVITSATLVFEIQREITQ